MLKYFWVDESGSFNTKYERYYIISAIVSVNAIMLQDIHKRAELIVRKDLKSARELKGAHMKDKQKAVFINGVLQEDDLQVLSLIVDKRVMKEKCSFKMSEFLIYNFALKELCKFALENGALHQNDKVLMLVDARSMNSKVYYDLESYLNLEFFHTLKSINVIYKDSSSNREIQLVDYISNSMYGYFNKTNDTYKKLEQKEKINYKIIPGNKVLT